MGDEYLEQFKAYCEQHEHEPQCPCGDKCKYIHPGWVKRMIAEIEQLTHIALAYGKEVVEKREENDALKKKAEALESALRMSISSQGHTSGCKCDHPECVRREAALNGTCGTIQSGV